MRPVFLIGYMGCGKTTLGRAAASMSSTRFIDLDEYIEAREGMTVSEIFRHKGEAYFRQIERDSLQEVASMTDVIVATGGGTPCQPGLMEIMLQAGTPVFLEVPVARLYSRLLQGRKTRPLIADMTDQQLREFITTALDARMPHYTRAAARFDSSRLESEAEIAETARRFIHSFITL